jgi:hypothetical protein
MRMKCEFKYKHIRWTAAPLAALGLVLAGCSNMGSIRRSGEEAQHNQLEVAHAERKEIGRAELWSQRCSQCHYARGADTFTPGQWEIIMFHMRVRANLTEEEHKAILEFLKSAR